MRIRDGAGLRDLKRTLAGFFRIMMPSCTNKKHASLNLNVAAPIRNKLHFRLACCRLKGASSAPPTRTDALETVAHPTSQPLYEIRNENNIGLMRILRGKTKPRVDSKSWRHSDTRSAIIPCAARAFIEFVVWNFHCNAN